MTEGDVLNIAQQAMTSILLLSAPLLGVALLVGLAVSIFQATTQIQEATLAFVPKIVAVLLTFLILGPWMLRMVMDFTINLFSNMNNFL